MIAIQFSNICSHGQGLTTEYCEDYIICFDIVAEPANKGVSQTMDIVFKTAQKDTYRTGVFALFVLDDVVFHFPTGYGFKRFSPLFETFNDKFGQLLASGIIHKINDAHFSFKRKHKTDIEPQVLTMVHLELGFITCLIPLGIATLIFFMGIVVDTTKKAFLKRL